MKTSSTENCSDRRTSSPKPLNEEEIATGANFSVQRLANEVRRPHESELSGSGGGQAHGLGVLQVGVHAGDDHAGLDGE